MNKKHLFYASAVAVPALALAIGSGAYAATTPQATAVLTEAQKTAIQQAHELRKQADEILKNAGLPVHPIGRGMFFKHIELSDEQKAVLEQAKQLREEGKADEAKALLKDAGLPEMMHFVKRGGRMERANITDEQKAVLERVRDLHEQGKIEEARALLESAGLPAMPKFKMIRQAGESAE